MSDIHGKYSHKAASKTISGSGVVDSLSPLLDQSYMMSASRSIIQVFEDEMSLGVNPFKSVVWSSPCKTWKSFEDKIIRILDWVKTKDTESDKAISVLSYPVDNMQSFEDPFDFAFISSDTVDSQTHTSTYEDLIQIEGFDVSFFIEKRIQKNEFELTVYMDDSKVSVFKIITSIKEYKVSIDAIEVEFAPKEYSSLMKAIRKSIKKPELWKCWYASGHALIGGMAFETELRTAKFEKHYWSDFDKKYNISKEKPINSLGKVDLTKIGNSDSLFCWIKNTWSPNFNSLSDELYLGNENSSGYLLCDDGSGEISDFVHIGKINDTYVQSFIHVKAKSSNAKKRGISVGALDIVVNQAVKNTIRYDRLNFLKELKEKNTSSTKMCWRDGKKITFSDFCTEVTEILEMNVGKIKKQVIVVQPHTVKEIFKTQDDKRSQQLNTLLLAAESSIKTADSDFFVIGSIEQ
jgi:hypothetical protein